MNSPGTDQELIQNYLGGDGASLETLVLRYFKSIYNFAYRLCGNAQDADDITAETFVKIWKNLKKYKPEQSFKTWIFAIARNTTIDWLRKRKDVVFSDFESSEGSNVLIDTMKDSSPLADEIAIATEEKKVLSEKVAKLSPVYQTVLVMRYNEEFTFREIGEILNKPIDTVKSWHRRALIELRKMRN